MTMSKNGFGQPNAVATRIGDKLVIIETDLSYHCTSCKEPLELQVAKKNNPFLYGDSFFPDNLSLRNVKYSMNKKGTLIEKIPCHKCGKMTRRFRKCHGFKVTGEKFVPSDEDDEADDALGWLTLRFEPMLKWEMKTLLGKNRKLTRAKAYHLGKKWDLVGSWYPNDDTDLQTALNTTYNQLHWPAWRFENGLKMPQMSRRQYWRERRHRELVEGIERFGESFPDWGDNPERERIREQYMNNIQGDYGQPSPAPPPYGHQQYRPNVTSPQSHARRRWNQ